jgi:hypothetical protein
MLERLHPHNNKNIFLLNIVQNSMNHITLQKKKQPKLLWSF